MTIDESGLTGAATQPQLHQPLGLAVLLRAGLAGTDLTPLGQSLLELTERHDDPYALLDLSLVLQIKQQRDAALAVQDLALRLRRHYRLKDATTAPPLRLLVLKAPGDLQANTPIECVLEGADDLQLEVLYLTGEPLADTTLPEHDLIFVAPSASDENAGVLAQMASLVQGSERRVLNRPERIGSTLRETAYALLGEAPGLCMAHTVRVPRAQLLDAAAGAFEPSSLVKGDYPFIVRPVGSHAGQGLVRVADRAELARYLEDHTAEEYYLAPFIDYSDADGLFRKYRIVLIEGRPFLCHMGISSHWMVHYPYPEMLAHPERRAEEAQMMATLDEDFARRHDQALRAIAEATGLDYVGFDCAETRDGRLLVFELATALVIHDMDDPQTFPYKRPQMHRVFAAFHAMLRRAAQRPEQGNATA